VTNATLWRELDSAISRQARVASHLLPGRPSVPVDPCRPSPQVVRPPLPEFRTPLQLPPHHPEHQEEQLRRFVQSRTRKLLRHVMEHPYSPQRPASPEVTVVSDRSMPIPDPDDGGTGRPRGRRHRKNRNYVHGDLPKNYQTFRHPGSVNMV
jgi:hypothetical protein